MPAVTIALASTAAVLVAYQVPLAVELPALALVGLVMRYFIRREVTRDTTQTRRVDKLEDELGDLRAEVVTQRLRSHDLESRNAALENARKLVLRAARRCSCKALEPVMALLEDDRQPTEAPT